MKYFSVLNKKINLSKQDGLSPKMSTAIDSELLHISIKICLVCKKG